MSALSKADLAMILCGTLGLSKVDAKVIIELFFEEIKQQLESGHTVKLSGFGNFSLRDKDQRPGRNPKTGQTVPVAARRVVTFKSGLKLKTNVEVQN